VLVPAVGPAATSIRSGSGEALSLTTPVLRVDVEARFAQFSDSLDKIARNTEARVGAIPLRYGFQARLKPGRLARSLSDWGRIAL